MLIHKLIPLSLVDGPGARLAIFVQGCPMQCVYCHNPETLHTCTACGACMRACPTGALTRSEDYELVWNDALCAECDACLALCPYRASPRTRQLTVSELAAVIARYRSLITGVTLSGGEPTRYASEIAELGRFCRQEGLSILLDTNGCCSEDDLNTVIPAVDGAMLDIKAWDPDEHLALTGQPLAPVLHSARRWAEAGKLAEVRTVVVPGYQTLPDTTDQIRAFVQQLSPQTPYRLIPVHAHGLAKRLPAATFNPSRE